ncbi:class I SAM-dependent methyltransferase [Maricaulis sp. CAU 1757]
MDLAYNRIAECRACGHKSLFEAFDLGDVPIAARLAKVCETPTDIPTAPLDILVCQSCTLMQLSIDVSPEFLFDENYHYFSSVSPQLMQHFKSSAHHLIEKLELTASSLVTEVASNDGYMLRHFLERGIPVFGVEPALSQCQRSREIGIPAMNDFFGLEVAQRCVKECGKHSDLVLGNNVLAHVPDINDFVRGIAFLMHSDATAVFEVPYLLDLIDGVEFDTIYHEHVFYYSVTALNQLFEASGLFITRIEPIAIHGGSIRVFVRKVKGEDGSLSSYLAEEARRGVADEAIYSQFGQKVTALADSLGALTKDLKAAGASIVGYGAAAKATTLLSVCGIGAETLDYLVDLSPFKQDKIMLGPNLEIFAPRRLLDDMPDYVLILAWNFADEIIEQLSEYKEAGGRFIVPVPEVRMV